MQIIQTLLAGNKSIVDLNRQQALEALDHALMLLSEHNRAQPNQAFMAPRPDSAAPREDRQI